MDLDIREFTKSLFKNSQGYFTSKSSQKVSYPDDGSDQCFLIEEISFWFIHRKNCILELLSLSPPPNNGVIFDIGGGNGFMTKAFEENDYHSVLVEPSLKGVQNAQLKRGLKNVICSTFESAQFENNSLPAVSAFDVIEHIENDTLFLKNIYSSLKKDGMLYLTVPAYNWLWSSTDDIGGHFRRYTCKSIRSLLEDIGFKIDFSTYFFRFLPPAIFLFRSIPYRIFNIKLEKEAKRHSKQHEMKPSRLKNAVLNKLLNSEITNIRKRTPMHYGGSCLVSAKK